MGTFYRSRIIVVSDHISAYEINNHTKGFIPIWGIYRKFIAKK